MTQSYQSATMRGPGGVVREIFYRRDTTDYPVLKQMFKQEAYSLKRWTRHKEIADFLVRKSAGGDRPLIVDAGANIGGSAVFFAVTYPRALVVAIEPEENNFALLSKNTDGLNVRCIKGGLSSSAGWMRIVDPGLGNWGFRTEPTGEGIGVRCVTVNDIYSEECRPGRAFPFIVKIDIEGAESDVFAKDTDWLAKTPLLIIELHDWLFPKAGTSHAFLQSLVGQKRDFVTEGENVFSLAHDLE